MEGPQPENHPSKYTEGRVRTGKEHAIRRLNWKTRKPCPTLEKLLCIYLLACEEALDHVTDEDLEPLALVVLEIQQYELEMSEKNWYSAAGGSTASQELEENVIKLRRLQCFARYGDYAVTLAHRGWEDISERLSHSEIAENLHKEAEYYDKNGPKSAPGPAPTSQAVHAACTAVGIDFHQTRLAIYAYGERYNAPHTNIFTLVEKDCGQAGHTLFRDIEDLSRMMPLEMETQEQALRAVLLELRDEWFDIEPHQFSDLAMWFPNYRLRREVEASRDPETMARARGEHEEWFARGAARRLAKLEEANRPTGQFGTGFETDGLPATQQPTGEDRKKAWHTIVSEGVGLEAFFRSSLQAQWEVHRVVSSYKKDFGRHLLMQFPTGEED